MKIAVMIIVCYSLLNQCSTDYSIQGYWINRDDRNYMIEITRDQFFEIYKNDTVLHSYSRSCNSCDTTYMKRNSMKLDFIKLNDGRCFEITGLTDSLLVYRHTISGRLLFFIKQKAK